MWLTYAIPFLVLSWAPLTGFDRDVIALAGVIIALSHWYWFPITAAFVFLGVGQLIVMANAEKLRDTGSAILWQDIAYTIPNLFGNLGTLLQYVGIFGILSGILALALMLSIRTIEKRIFKRSLHIGIAFSVALMLLYLPTSTDYVLRVASDMKLFQNSAQSFAGQLSTTSLARFLHSSTLRPAEFQGESGDSSIFAELSAGTTTDKNLRRTNAPPDLFVVLNESQFDPSQIAACTDRPGCRLAMYANNPHSVRRGPLKVHTHGWGTWNAEFTLMTGVPYFWFGESGFYSPYTTAPRIQLGLAQHLSTLGYRTIGIYPTQKGMLNAATAYRHYGVQEFYGAEDLDLSLDWCSIPDELMYRKLLEKYRAARSEDLRPIFMVMLTVLNHGPHGDGCMEAKLQNILGKRVDPLIAKFEDFLDRSKTADKASTAFRNTILAQSNRVLLLVAGDHQPSFEGLAARYPRRMHRPMPARDELFFTNYQFFANYENGVVDRGGEKSQELDISFLASTLLELANLPPGPLFEPNLQLRNLCSGRLDACPIDLIDSYKSHMAKVGFYK